MRKLYILHHLGLGDHIICNGLIRKVLDDDSVVIFMPVKIHNIFNIFRMFIDISQRINIIPVENDRDMILFSRYFKHDEIIKIGIFNETYNHIHSSFCEKFYRQLDFDYSARWDRFHIQENNSTYIKNYNNEECFVHEDRSRNLLIKEAYLKGKSCYRPDHTLGVKDNNTIFDYVEILKNVKEIHCMDSSFACLIDHLPYLAEKKKFIHRYIRESSENPVYKNSWTILYE